MPEKAKILIGLSVGRLEIAGAEAFVEEKLGEIEDLIRQFSGSGCDSVEIHPGPIQTRPVQKTDENERSIPPFGTGNETTSQPVVPNEPAVERSELSINRRNRPTWDQTELFGSGLNKGAGIVSGNPPDLRTSRTHQPFKKDSSGFSRRKPRQATGKTAAAAAAKAISSAGTQNQPGSFKRKTEKKSSVETQKQPGILERRRYSNVPDPHLRDSAAIPDIPPHFKDWFDMFPRNGDATDFYLLTAYFVQSASRVEVFDTEETRNKLASAGFIIDAPGLLLKEMKDREYVLTVKKTEKEHKSRLTPAGMARIVELMKG